jgi:tripartite ATP-independent transporter DctM subunit
MVLLLILLGLVLVGFPIAFAIGLTCVAFLAVQGKLFFLQMFPQKMFTSLDVFPFLAVPFFILAGNLMNYSGITRDLVTFVDRLVGHIRGGLAHVSVIASMIFAGITGAAVAEASALGSVLIPMMEESKYDKEFAASVIASASVIGPIIPPSIIMVIYALVAGNVSIAAMFVAGVVPGVIMGLLLMALIGYYASRRKYPRREQRASLGEVATSFRKAIFPVLMPVIIMGGILSGIFTPTEASAVSVVYALFVGLVIMKTLHVRDLPRIFVESAITTAVVQLVVAAASVLSWIITIEKIPQQLSGYFMSRIQDPLYFNLFVVALLLVVGCFLDPASGLIITVPILLPTAMALGIDPLFFGIVVTVTLNIGLITPPVGACLYVACGIANITLERLSRAIFVFVVAEIATVLILVLFPRVVWLLPHALGFR